MQHTPDGPSARTLAVRVDRRLAAAVVLVAPLGLAACGLLGGSNNGAAPVVIQSATETPGDAASPTTPGASSDGTVSSTSGVAPTAGSGADVAPVTTTVTQGGQVIVQTRIRTQVAIQTKTAVQTKTQVQTQQVTKNVTLPPMTVTETQTQTVTQPANPATKTVTDTKTVTQTVTVTKPAA